MGIQIQVSALGDRALLFTLSEEISEQVNDLVLHACSEIERARVPGVEEAQPAYSSFCVHFDPSRIGAPWLKAYVRNLLETLGSEAAPTGEGRREVEIPVKYGGEGGPDLEWASEHLGISPEEVVRRHASARYRVYMIGFAPGFPYLGGMDQSIAMPRLPTPRTAIPAGSVGIGGGQTGVYPWESPGGWRIIGRTPLKLFDPSLQGPSLLQPGDTVRFVPVDGMSDTASSSRHATAPMAGQTKPQRISDALHPSVPAFAVEHPGLLSLVVDGGRRGYRKLGVPLSGAADANSYALANVLCGNPRSAPALEMTLWGARLRALMDIVVAVTGAPSPVSVNDVSVPMNEPVLVREGSLLEVGSPPLGCRMYLAVSGGFSVPMVLGSASTYLRGSFGGFEGRRLMQGDVLRAGPGAGYEEMSRSAPRRVVEGDLSGWPERLSRFLTEGSHLLRVIPGPESTSAAGQEVLRTLCSQTYIARGDSDRMGIRLDGPTLAPYEGSGDILSSPVVPGVVQVPSDGRPVLLISDAQTSGGYRRIATVVGSDLPLAGQIRPGATVRFAVAAGRTELL